VLAWKQGLPPTWTRALHEDAVTEAFAALHLTEDPRVPADDDSPAIEVLEYLDERVEMHGLSTKLRDAVVNEYARAQWRWEPALENGTLAKHPRLAQLALTAAIRSNDAQLLAKLEAAGLSFNGPLQGSARPVQVAVLKGSFAAAAFLAPRTKPVPPRLFGESHVPPSVECVRAMKALRWWQTSTS